MVGVACETGCEVGVRWWEWHVRQLELSMPFM